MKPLERAEIIKQCGPLGGEFIDYIYSLPPEGVSAFNDFMQRVKSLSEDGSGRTLAEVFEIAENELGRSLQCLLEAA
jgi:hypothetical protein